MSKNGKSNGFSLANLPQPGSETASYQHKLRMAMYDAITEGDVAEIVKGLVQRAKEGDEKAVRMVFDYLMGGNKPPAQATQINVYPPAQPAKKPTKAIRGTGEKIDALAKRAMNGEDLFHPHDFDAE